jgi:hypothetical protein
MHMDPGLTSSVQDEIRGFLATATANYVRQCVPDDIDGACVDALFTIAGALPDVLDRSEESASLPLVLDVLRRVVGALPVETPREVVIPLCCEALRFAAGTFAPLEACDVVVLTADRFCPIAEACVSGEALSRIFNNLFNRPAPCYRAGCFTFVRKFFTAILRRSSDALAHRLWAELPYAALAEAAGEDPGAQIAFAEMIGSLAQSDVACCDFDVPLRGHGLFLSVNALLGSGSTAVAQAALHALAPKCEDLPAAAVLELVRDGFCRNCGRVWGTLMFPEGPVRGICRVLELVEQLAPAERAEIAEEIAQAELIEQIESVNDELGDTYDDDVVEDVRVLWARIAGV